MFKVLFTTKAIKSVDSVNEALLRETGDPEWRYETIEEINRDEREGFLEFKDGNMTVRADM